jgi:DNA-binding transcriptional ArsR family regulator
MAYLIQDTKEGQKAYKAALIKPKKLNVLNSDLALKIVSELAKQPSCAMDLARRLKQHEQKIYYHLRRLDEAGFIKLLRTEKRVGALAKIYTVLYPIVSVKLFEGEYAVDVKTKAREIQFFNEFVDNGRLNATIIVGSPDLHGKYDSQASDGCCAIDLALFLGSFLTTHTKPNYKLDTEIRNEDLKDNLILIGGPKANMIIEKINSELPVFFDSKHEFDLYSSLSKTLYSGDDIGLVIKMKNPFAKNKQMLILAGKRFKGTRAAVIALVKHLKEVERGNRLEGNIIRVVRGIDRDSDGRIDDVEFLE